jgi:hypothetical protein
MGYASGDETHHDLPAVFRRAGSDLCAFNYIGRTEPLSMGGFAPHNAL